MLIDNFPGSHIPTEYGLSYLIDYEGKKTLFDTGQSDMFLRNAGRMNIDIRDVDAIVLSHGHFDHGNGLGHLAGGRLICHPGSFVKRFRKNERNHIGLKLTKDQICEKFDLVETKGPFKISENIIFSGEIARNSKYESQSTPFVFEDGTPDYVMDDGSLILVTGPGLFVITGCGHSGIINTLEHARKITGESRLNGIMGGFHLKEVNRQTTETIRYLKDNNVRHIYPAHCTSLPALSAFFNTFKVKQVRTGDILSF